MSDLPLSLHHHPREAHVSSPLSHPGQASQETLSFQADPATDKHMKGTGRDSAEGHWRITEVQQMEEQGYRDPVSAGIQRNSEMVPSCVASALLPQSLG